jgi:hypothetical protein
LVCAVGVEDDEDETCTTQSSVESVLLAEGTFLPRLFFVRFGTGIGGGRGVFGVRFARFFRVAVVVGAVVVEVVSVVAAEGEGEGKGEEGVEGASESKSV